MKNKKEEPMKKNNKAYFKIGVLAAAILGCGFAQADDKQSAEQGKLAFFNLPPAAPELIAGQKTSLSVYDLKSYISEDGGTEIRVDFNGFPVEPKATKVDDKEQLILNFGKVNLDLKKNVNHASTDQVRAFKFAKNTQGDSILAIALGEHGNFTTRKTDNAYILKIYPKMVQSLASTSFVKSHGLENVSFNRTKGGEDQAIIQLSNSNTPVAIKQVGSKVLVRFKGINFQAHQMKAQNFNDIRAILTSAKMYNEGADGVIELTPSGSYEYMAMQVEKTLTINFAKKTANKVSGTVGLNGERFVGRKISMDFQNVEVRKVLQLLANYTGTNIVASDNVSGFISLKLQDVPWDQALSVILKTRNLAQRKDGNVIWVAPTEEVEKYETTEAKAYAQSIKLAPLESVFVQLNYATAADVVALIRMEGGADKENSIENRQLLINRLNANSGDESSLLSPRGSITHDARTNMVIISDTAKKVEEIKRIISQIDIPVRQVMVEARIVRASTNFSKAMGVKWGVAKDGSQGISGNMSNLYNSSRYGKANEADAVDSNVNLDLGQTVGTSSIAFGLINTTNTLLALELSALQSDGQGEVLSTPKVMTGDKQEATIKSGVKLPYKTTDDDGKTTTTFQDAVIELTVVPSITPDGTVQMKLTINKDTQGQLTDAGYAIDTNQLTTNVLVNNGETVVLGGLYEDTKTSEVQKVPVLGDVPFVGKLFRSNSKLESKQELLIFITPKIVEDNSAKVAQEVVKSKSKK